VCCSVLQCGAVCCSVLQCVAVHCSVVLCVAVCCSVLQFAKECLNQNVTTSNCSPPLYTPHASLSLSHLLSHNFHASVSVPLSITHTHTHTHTHTPPEIPCASDYVYVLPPRVPARRVSQKSARC